MRAENLTKAYGEKQVLNELSFSIEEGKITALLGESGVGKTTLLNAIAGMVDYEGKIEGIGQVSYLFQEGKLLPNLTVEGNLKLVLNKEEWDKIPDMLARVGLQGREKDYPKTLSGGEKQRVAIARAFLFPHKVLLMDEPFASLDLKRKKSLLNLVYSLWEAQKNTVLFVTHDVKEAVLLAHTALVLKEGKIADTVTINSPHPRDFLGTYPEEKTLASCLMKE